MISINHIFKRLNIAFSGEFKKLLYRKGIPEGEIIENNSSGEIHFVLLGVRIPKTADTTFLTNGYGYAKKMKSVLAAEFSWDSSGLFLRLNGVNHQIQTEEDLFILYEIYIEGVYNYTYNKPHLIADIGMNVCFSSLYFANKSNVVSIVSFEPFKPTFDQALKNISLNPSLQKKITPYNFGFGETDDSLSLDYNYDWKGSVGANGIPERFADKVTVSRQQISIRAIDFLNNEILRDATLPVGIKIDCEGAEYGIIKRLVELPLIKNVAWIMMEWHLKGPEELISYLNKVGFSAISLSPYSKGTGMIYAFRQVGDE